MGAVIRPGEVGIKQTLGKLSDDVQTEGTVFYNPITSKIVKESTQTKNIKLFLTLPSKEGLSVNSEISILHRLEGDKVASVLKNLGRDYESVITSVFRSAASDVCAQFFAKDMHSGMRANIEAEILKKMKVNLEKQADGIELIAVLMQEKLEAERKIINAKGERDAQIIISEGLTDGIIRIKAIEAFKALSQSANSKIIITDGKTPLMVNDATKKEEKTTKTSKA